MRKPSFLSTWTAAQRIYSSNNPSAHVAKIIGGYVEKTSTILNHHNAGETPARFA